MFTYKIAVKTELKHKWVFQKPKRRGRKGYWIKVKDYQHYRGIFRKYLGDILVSEIKCGWSYKDYNVAKQSAKDIGKQCLTTGGPKRRFPTELRYVNIWVRYKDRETGELKKRYIPWSVRHADVTQEILPE